MKTESLKLTEARVYTYDEVCQFRFRENELHSSHQTILKFRQSGRSNDGEFPRLDLYLVVDDFRRLCEDELCTTHVARIPQHPMLKPAEIVGSHHNHAGILGSDFEIDVEQVVVGET